MHNLLTISVEVKMCISKVWFINIYEVQRLTLLVRVLNTTFGSVTVNIYLFAIQWLFFYDTCNTFGTHDHDDDHHDHDDDADHHDDADLSCLLRFMKLVNKHWNKLDKFKVDDHDHHHYDHDDVKYPGFR